FYVLVFGFATDQVMDHLGLDADYRAESKASLYTVESHIRYLDEVALGSQLRVVPHLVSAGEKRLHLAYEMFVADRLVATEEIMALHVDQAADAVVPFPATIAEGIERIGTHRPDWVGRASGGERGPGAGGCARVRVGRGGPAGYRGGVRRSGRPGC